MSTSYIGTIVGHANNGSVTATDVYCVDNSGVTAKIGYVGKNTAANSAIQTLTGTQLNGSNAQSNMNVDFYVKDTNEKGVWLTVIGSHPVLKSFVTSE